jgi:hypothetical protein
MSKVIILNSRVKINNQIINDNDNGDKVNNNKKKILILNKNTKDVIKDININTKDININIKDHKDIIINTKDLNINTKDLNINTKDLNINTKDTIIKTKKISLNTKNNDKPNEIKIININNDKSNDNNNDLNINEINNELDLIFDTCEKGSNVDNKIILLEKKIKYNDREKEKILKSVVKIPKEHFKRKIDLTVKDDTIDPSLDCTIKGREEYKNKKHYEKLPEKLKELDKTHNKKSLFGNLPAPKNLTERFL